jgi:PadR family transcriptional regulator PadR
MLARQLGRDRAFQRRRHMGADGRPGPLCLITALMFHTSMRGYGAFLLLMLCVHSCVAPVKVVAVTSSGQLGQNAERRSCPECISPCLPREEVLVSVTEDIMSRPSDLVQGTLDMSLLKILALEPMNGFAVGQRLTQVSGDVLQVSDGSLYPALHKLEQEGWITAEWKTSEYGRRAKYYSLTRFGRRQLEKEADAWDRLSSTISRVIKLRDGWAIRILRRP